MRVRAFVRTFHTPKYSTWAKSDEKCLQNALPTYFSTFTNLRLGSINFMLPKRRCWKAEQTFRSVFSKHFSMFSRPNEVLTYAKSSLIHGPKALLGFPKSSFGEHKLAYPIRRGYFSQMLFSTWLVFLGKTFCISFHHFYPKRSYPHVFRRSKIFVWDG
jgi:hypothetical protein